MARHGFDSRVVLYENIHDIKSKDEKALLRAIDPRSGQKILDAFCGYGAVSQLILTKQKKTDLWLNDESSVQLKRARKNLPAIDKSHFSKDSFPKNNFNNNFFDTIVIKMGLHEVPKKEQLKVLNEFYRILKPKGKLVLWDIMLNEQNQRLFQDIIRKKDELAGFDMLVKERYFFREDEFLKNAKKSGFNKVKDFHTINYRFSSRNRLSSELRNKVSLLKKLNDYIRKRFPKNLIKPLNYKDKEDDILFDVKKKIYVLTK